MKLQIFVYFFPFITAVCAQDTLRFVQIIFRHGDRTPTKLFPSDTRGESIWPNGLGQLTQLGIQQEYQLGQYFRKRYSSFLNDTYVKNDISVVSTDKDRTLMSAYSLLAGLYPPQGSQKWGAAKNISLGKLWQPIPVKSLPYDTDPLLSTNVPCPLYNDLYEEQLNSDDGKDVKKHYKQVIDHVIKYGGWEENNLDNVFDTYYILYIMKLKNKEPEWAHKDPDLVEELEMLKLRQYDLKFKTLHMIQLLAGTFLNELLNNTNSWINNQMSPKKKVMLYSSHDSMIGAIMFALNIWNDILPPYACAILFELHETSPGQYVVKVLYKNDTVSNALDGEAYPMKIPDCNNDDCDIESFRTLLSPVILKNREEECKKSRFSYSTAAVVISIAVVVLVVVAIGLVIWCRRKKRPNFDYRSANFSGDEPDVLT